jgi:hypothetical protein
MTTVLICDQCRRAEAIAYDDRDYYAYCGQCVDKVLVLGRIVYFAPGSTDKPPSPPPPRPAQPNDSGVLQTFLEHVLGWLENWEIGELRRLFGLPSPKVFRSRRKRDRVSQ